MIFTKGVGIVNTASNYSVDQTVERLKKILSGKRSSKYLVNLKLKHPAKSEG